MPTSTATVMVSFNGPKVTKLPVSTKKKGAATKHTVATLRSLYNRAAKAFIQRDMVLTYSLITSAFSNLHSPVSSSPDSLNSQRRKWDVLRVTLEATVYTSNTPSPVSLLPESLQMTLRLSPPSVIATMHTRSLQLFTPSNHSRPTAEFLPSQVLVTLALASVKLDCPQVGREIVEDWLHRRNNRPSEELSQDSKLRAEALDGYEKVIEVYCLHLLPRLGEWDYIREFLAYERELLEERRMQLLRTVERLRSEYVTGIDRSRQQERVPSVSFSPSSPSPSTSSSRTATPKVAPNTPSSSNPDRAPSPSPSVTSASTTSTHTAVPTRRPNGLQPATSSTTPTPLTQSPVHLRPPRSITDSTTSTIQRPAHVVSPQSHKAVSSSYPSSSSSSSEIISSRSVSQPSLITLIRSTLIPHLTKSKISFFVIMCLVSFVSYLFRLRRKRLRVLSSTGSSSATTPSKLITFHAGDLEEVRRRLGGTGLWAGAKRAIYDVARMAVGGLA